MTSTRTNTFSPTPTGSNPKFPSGPATVASGNSVSQSVVSQSNSLPEVALTYTDKCSASATASTGVTPGTPSVTDDIQP